MATQPTEKLWNKTFFLLLLVNLFSGMSGQMTIPIVTKYALSLGAPLTLAGTISSLMSWASLIVCPIAGFVADRVNRKKLLASATLFNGLFILLHAFVKGVPLLVAIRLLTGIAFSFMSVCLVAFTSSFVPRARFGEGMGYLALATILAQAVGPSVSLELLNRSGYALTFTVSGLFALACAVVIIILHYEAPAKPAVKRSIHFNDLFAVKLLPFTILVTLFSAANGLASSFIALVGDERGIGNIALFFTAYSICMVAIRPVSGKLLDKKGIYFILFPAYIFAAAGLILVGVGHVLWLIVLAGVLKAFGQGAGVPSIQAHCVKYLGSERAGVATSTCQIGQNIGNAIAPMFGAVVADAAGYNTLFTGYGIILLVAGWALLFWQYRRDQAAA